MSAMGIQITGVSILCSLNSAQPWWICVKPVGMKPQPFVQARIKENSKTRCHWHLWRGLHRSPVDSPHKGPVTRKMFSFGDVIIISAIRVCWLLEITPSPESMLTERIKMQIFSSMKMSRIMPPSGCRLYCSGQNELSMGKIKWIHTAKRLRNE